MKFDKESAIRYIEDFTWSKTRLGLSRTRELLSLLGNPQEKLKFIHVAGSNGKGSFCAMTERILREAGYVTGLYTSPYLVDFTEQLTVCGEPITGEELSDIVERVAPVADSMTDHPSRFEILTAVSMLWFLQKKCDIVILEVGMGGEMDSTNVIPPAILSVIMNIGIEHQEFLGDTIEEIAKAKAGIIKSGTHAICYDGDEDAVNVVKTTCDKLNVPLIIPDFAEITLKNIDVDGMEFSTEKHDDLRVSIVGTHQLNNISMVLAGIEVLVKLGFNISDEHIRTGLKNTKWPARFQVLCHDPLFILDGGHNPQCARAVVDTLEMILPDVKFTVLFGMLSDKDHESIIKMLLPFADSFVCVTPDNPRAISAREVAQKIGDRADTIVADSVEEGLKICLEKNVPVLALGSLYMAGTIIDKFVNIGKSVQRRRALRLRDSLTKEELARSAEDICAKLMENTVVKNADIIFSYLAKGSEVDLKRLHEFSLESKKKLAFPFITGPGIMEARVMRNLSPESFFVDRFGILTPKPECSEAVSPSDIDLILAPCVAFDENGNRLGYGGGYYDRYLPKTKCEKILVAHKIQKLAEIISDKWDIVFKEKVC